MPEIITLKGKAQAEGQSVTGYKFPDKIEDFPIPATLLTHPNYTPALWNEDMSQVLQNPKVLTIVDVKPNVGYDKRGYLITQEGYKLLFQPNSSQFVYTIPNEEIKSPVLQSSSQTKELPKIFIVKNKSRKRRIRNRRRMHNFVDAENNELVQSETLFNGFTS